MAEISLKHLKPDDLIYVSGQLGFYTKADDNERAIPRHKVHDPLLSSYSLHAQLTLLTYILLFPVNREGIELCLTIWTAPSLQEN